MTECSRTAQKNFSDSFSSKQINHLVDHILLCSYVKIHGLTLSTFDAILNLSWKNGWIFSHWNILECRLFYKQDDIFSENIHDIIENLFLCKCAKFYGFLKSIDEATGKIKKKKNDQKQT